MLKSKIISCITFFNEVDLLLKKISYESEYVDNFIIIESRKTFSGEDKILYFEKYQYLFEPFKHKILYYQIDNLPSPIKINYRGHNNLVTSEYRWHLEEFTRNCFKNALQDLNSSDEDIIVISDADEFIDFEFLSRNLPSDGELIEIEMFDYRYSISRPPIGLINGPCILKYKHAKRMNLHFARQFKIDNFLKSSLRPIYFNIKYSSYFSNGKIDKLDAVSARYFYRKRILSEFHKIIKQDNLRYSIGRNPIFCGIKIVKIYSRKGWHFSNMFAGLQPLYNYKVNSFSHSEYSDLNYKFIENGTKISDHYSILSKYINKNFNKFDRGNIDNNIPNFIKDDINNLSVLLNLEDKIQ